MTKPKRGKNAYARIIERIFKNNYSKGASEITFSRDELVAAAEYLHIPLPKNLGDIVYSFRYRNELPESVRKLAPENTEWIIRPAGKAKYKFVASAQAFVSPNPMLAETKIPNATPGVIESYSLSDEQALLAKLRYNRMIDIFTGLTCYSLQNHLRTHVSHLGQVETDEVYTGIEKRGCHYILPVQAKGGADRLGIIQIEQDVALCKEKFESLLCRPIAAQFIDHSLIALFAFEFSDGHIAIASEKHYRLAPPDDISLQDLETYRMRGQVH